MKKSKKFDTEESFDALPELTEENINKEKISEPINKNHLTIDGFISNSRDVRKAGKYLEVGFREWYRKSKKDSALSRLTMENWLKEFEKFKNS